MKSALLFKDINEDLGQGWPGDRVLYHGKKVDPFKLTSLTFHNESLFGVNGGICSSTPFLLAASLIIARSTPLILEMAQRYEVALQGVFRQPFEVCENATLRVAEGVFDDTEPQLQSQFSVHKVFPLGKHGSGVALVKGDFAGTYVVSPGRVNRGIYIRRCLNTAPVSHSLMEEYFRDVDFQEACGQSSRFRNAIFSFIKKEMPKGSWSHELLQTELHRIGYPLPDEYLSITMSKANDKVFF